MKLVPWKYNNRRYHPKKFSLALRMMMDSSLYNLTERSLAIAAGVTRASVQEWLDGRSHPSEAELIAISSAFILNAIGSVPLIPRNTLLNEFKDIIKTEKKADLTEEDSSEE